MFTHRIQHVVSEFKKQDDVYTCACTMIGVQCVFASFDQNTVSYAEPCPPFANLANRVLPLLVLLVHITTYLYLVLAECWAHIANTADLASNVHHTPMPCNANYTTFCQCSSPYHPAQQISAYSVWIWRTWWRSMLLYQWSCSDSNCSLTVDMGRKGGSKKLMFCVHWSLDSLHRLQTAIDGWAFPGSLNT